MLKLTAYVQDALLTPEALARLSAVLSGVFPEFSRVGLAEDEDDDPLWLFEMSAEEALSALGITGATGEVLMVPSATSGVTVYVLGAPPSHRDPRAKAILIDLEGRGPYDERALALLRGIVVEFRCHHARACRDGELSATNMHRGNDGTYAIGVRLEDGLPGLYWANFLGPAYVQAIDFDFIAGGWERIDGGVMRVLYPASTDWASDSASVARARELAAWGDSWVFDRTRPNRRLRAPVFERVP